MPKGCLQSFAIHAGHSDGHVGVELDLLYGPPRAEVSNSGAVVLGHSDDEAVVALLPGERLL